MAARPSPALYARALARALTLAWLSVAGLVQAVLAVVILILSIAFGFAFFFPVTRTVVRRGAERARDRVARWSGMRIPSPYLPPPPPPVPQPDGMYRVGRTLYKTPRVPARIDRQMWMFSDPATWRDVAWRLLDPFVAAAFGVLPLLVIGYGLAVGWLWTPLAAPLGIAVAVATLAVLPWLIRAYTLWTRQILSPADRSLLDRRLRQLVRSRREAIDSQAAELRRIERELHDGAQARLVAVGMTLDAARRAAKTDPAEARALLARAREESAAALGELRRVVRGIHPPVLAERGLGDAVRALALDNPLKAEVTVDLPVRPDAPVESAAYFAIGGVLDTLARDPKVRAAHVDISHRGPRLRLAVTVNGGEDIAEGEFGEIERRLSAFDGVLAVSTAPGGPTMVTMDLPHALSGTVADETSKMPLWKTTLVVLGISLGWLPLFPQGTVPAVMKIIGTEDPGWFLALHLPEPFQWPVIVFMILLGLFLYSMVTVLPLTHERRQPDAVLPHVRDHGGR
ncbi:sensor histidine kinase [Thermostaphylospora chromogena]|uniref:histidine kinase n=1 Tax=Thermostaphylospora chromogena TaxID=35622 RepID=A0A1H1CFH1_9ACTN|nr:histidine kinase [Thermostaphylospora chromogena]SDQ62914.1 Signal transduction histidine kinase [Thermostaphylospora chromogena]